MNGGIFTEQYFSSHSLKMFFDECSSDNTMVKILLGTKTSDIVKKMSSSFKIKATALNCLITTIDKYRNDYILG